MKQVIATVWEGSDPVSYHTINLPDFGQPGHYTQGISASAFGQRESKRLYASHMQGKHFMSKRASLTFDVKDVSHQWMRENMKCPEFEHANIWDFYTAVGYDRHKQRWNTNEKA